MIFISHRGNITGPITNKENQWDYILNALEKGFEVEIDLWKNNYLYLGHSEPKYKISKNILEKYSSSLWIHCKNLEALLYCMDKKFHCFWHESDAYALTSKGYIWAHPNSKIFMKTIMVMPEKKYGINDYNFDENIIGVCTDYPLEARDNFL